MPPFKDIGGGSPGCGSTELEDFGEIEPGKRHRTHWRWEIRGDGGRDLGRNKGSSEKAGRTAQSQEDLKGKRYEGGVIHL